MTQTIHGSAFLSQRGSAYLSPRALVMGALVGAHVLLAYFLANGLSSTNIHVLLSPLETIFVEDPIRPPPPPQLLDPRLEKPDVIDLGPPPEPTSEPMPTEPSGALTGPVSLVPPDAGPGSATVQPAADPIRLIGKHRLPNTEDYYPADLRRRGIEGAANVRVCVDERGSVQGQPSVEKSSGNPRLDEGAVNVVRDGHYARAMQGAAFVANCYGFRVIFQMR